MALMPQQRINRRYYCPQWTDTAAAAFREHS
jgi:hypothetical protein